MENAHVVTFPPQNLGEGVFKAPNTRVGRNKDARPPRDVFNAKQISLADGQPEVVVATLGAVALLATVRCTKIRTNA